jgi:REP element-mobilizing transposase RayT
VTSRGDRRGSIYFDDTDRLAWLDVLATVCARFNFIVHSICQMTNHYHLMVETIDGERGRGMRQLNGAYSQHFNRRHGLVGHVFQGRYKAILVQKESYLLELARYVVLNPIRAGMVDSLDDWRWSSHPYFMCAEGKPEWLEADWLLGLFGSDRQGACRAYKEFVLNGRGLLSPLREVRHQTVLGDRAFVEQHLNMAASEELGDIARTQRRSVTRSLEAYANEYSNRDEAMAQAYWSMAYSMREIARHFGTSTRTVGRAVKHFKVKV